MFGSVRGGFIGSRCLWFGSGRGQRFKYIVSRIEVQGSRVKGVPYRWKNSRR